MTFGIDISTWQKGLSLAQAQKEGVQFVIAKAGGADAGYYKDSQFENFYKQATNCGLPIGSYYFGKAFSTDQAKTEANYFIKYLQGKNIKNVWYDVEGKMLNQDKNTLTNIIKTFCDTLIQAGYRCGVYTSLSHFNSKFIDSALINYPHWVACYGTKKPSLKSGAIVEIWQFGGNTNYIRNKYIAGHVCDQDYCYLDIWNASPTPTPVPPPSSYMIIDGLNYSPVFDPVYYKNKYSDIANSIYGTSNEMLWQHFVDFGMNEFRQASENFNPQVYKDNNPDVANSIYGQTNAGYYRHFVEFGQYENRIHK